MSLRRMKLHTDSIFSPFMYDNAAVVSHRSAKEKVNAWKPYHFIHETEPDRNGELQRINTIFLTNRECPFKCVFCDLWKHTLDDPTPKGAIPAQIRYALDRLPKADVIKLYNSGNFFDVSAIPLEDYPEIATLISDYKRVIVENHPRIGRKHILPFQKMLTARLEIALGIETIHPEVLPKLNKKVTVQDIEDTVHFCISNGIDLRGFILLNPPFITNKDEYRYWCLETVKFAFNIGFSTVSIIPVRTGNGLMERLLDNGAYIPPDLTILESVFCDVLKMKKGIVFIDLWDIEQFWQGDKNLYHDFKNRLEMMNQTQRAL